jgi:hypothetical protein
VADSPQTLAERAVARLALGIDFRRVDGGEAPGFAVALVFARLGVRVEAQGESPAEALLGLQAALRVLEARRRRTSERQLANVRAQQDAMRAQTHCKRGHELPQKKPGAAQRRCKLCASRASSDYRKRKKQNTPSLRIPQTIESPVEVPRS